MIRDPWIDRLKVLATGKLTWVGLNGDSTEYLGWRDRWDIVGIHSADWGWVRRYGGLDCGCTHNPLTRRLVLIRMDCAEHCCLGPLQADL